MNEDDDCMIELETHKSENGGRIATTFVMYLKEKYSPTVVKKCVSGLS
tara:strand:+ start:446 stop:589 length:144 start_codon:yes stop_codon:yes gene_type:complete